MKNAYRFTARWGLCSILFWLLCCLSTAGLAGDGASRATAGPPPSGSTWQQPADWTQGIVLTAEGNPTAGVHVFPMSCFMGHCGIENPVVTGPDGSFHLRWGLGSDPWIIVEPEGGPVAFARVAFKQPVRLGAGTEIRIPFVDQDGKPLADRRVAVFPSTGTGPLTGVTVNHGFPGAEETLLKARMMVTTDARGVASFSGLPQGQRVSVVIKATALYPPLELDGGVLLSRTAVTNLAPVQIALNGSISGRVIYRATGKPAPGIQVRLVGPGYHNYIGMATTDGAGRYQFAGLFPAAYWVDAWAPEEKPGQRWQVLARSPEGKWLSSDNCLGGEITPGKRLEGLDFGLVRAATVKVTVYELGRSAFPADVRLWTAGGGGEGCVVSPDGSAEFHVDPGEYRVTWTRDRYDDKPVGEQTITVADGATWNVVFGRLAPGKLSDRRALAPDITVQDLDNRPLKLSDLRGKAVILALCSPELESYVGPALKTFDAAAGKAGAGVYVLVVDIQGQDPDNRGSFQKWAAAHADLKYLHFTRDATDWHRTGRGQASMRFFVDGDMAYYVIARDGSLICELGGKPGQAQVDQAIKDALGPG